MKKLLILMLIVFSSYTFADVDTVHKFEVFYFSMIEGKPEFASINHDAYYNEYMDGLRELERGYPEEDANAKNLREQKNKEVLSYLSEIVARYENCGEDEHAKLFYSTIGRFHNEVLTAWDPDQFFRNFRKDYAHSKCEIGLRTVCVVCQKETHTRCQKCPHYTYFCSKNCQSNWWAHDSNCIWRKKKEAEESGR